MPIAITTDRLISATEARRHFGKLLSEVAHNSSAYFVILDNGKVSGVLGNQEMFQGKNFASLPEIRKDWDRHTGAISDALQKLSKKKRKDLPKLFRS